VLPTRNPKIIFKALETGAVLYSPQDEVYFGLNPVGVRVWELLPPAHQHLDDVCRVLTTEYPDAPLDVIRADVAELLEELGKLGLVVPADGSKSRAS
jgi:Coenzyme PQQ synthesis protein D (PqqD)